MQNIHVLDEATIDKIAAGEVVERPGSAVKELTENAIDAGADHITVEIKNGGIDYIRVTDNGAGIEKDDIKTAFLRHATSKIQKIEDLFSVNSLGFRGEALSSISAVSRTELLTKTAASFCGYRYVIEGGREMVFEEAGVPNGTTLIVRNLFYNVPARRKFLKTAQTEANHITELMERLMLSHPKIAFKYIVNGTVKMQTNGDGDLKTILCLLYGRDIYDHMLPLRYCSENIEISGFIGEPELARSNHNYEFYFVNLRSVKSAVLNRALDEAYREYLMLHKFPYAILNFTIPSELLDVNVHPTKLEVRFLNADEVYQALICAVQDTLRHKELIPEAKEEGIKVHSTKPLHVLPEPFEQKRLYDIRLSEDPVYQPEPVPALEKIPATEYEQPSFLSEEARKKHRLIGQLFDTYWLVEYDEKLFLIDQHAAHEKIRYERFVKHYREQVNDSQFLNPPLILSLSRPEEESFLAYREEFEKVGFEIEHFGGLEYAIRAVPTELYGLKEMDYFRELLDALSAEKNRWDMDSVLAHLASMSCKGAVKAGNKISMQEADALLDELLSLDNPYHCPHGRPVILSYSKTELEKKFKRIVS